MKTAKRLETVKEYYFSHKLREVRKLLAEGKPVINLGIGSPDLLPDPGIVDAMRLALSESGVHQYQPYTGIPEFREAISGFYGDRFGVSLDRDTQVLPLMGSKEGIMHLSMAYLDPGDRVWIPNPGYPTYRSVAQLMQAEVEEYPLLAENGYFPDLQNLESRNPAGVKIMWVNYPHMPTGAVASAEQLSRLWEFCRRYDILLVNDNPYAFVLNDQPVSLLSVPGASEGAVELNSLSKTFNLAGWRMGMLVGAPGVIQAALKVKSNMDSGMFRALQAGAIRALNSNVDWYEALNTEYRARKERTLQLCDLLGLDYETDTAGMFVWARLPQGAPGSEEFSDHLLHDHHLFAAPGTVFGSLGEGYIRFSLCVPRERMEEAIARIERSQIKIS